MNRETSRVRDSVSGVAAVLGDIDAKVSRDERVKLSREKRSAANEDLTNVRRRMRSLVIVKKIPFLLTARTKLRFDVD
jgi:hypothetical protein